MKEKFLNIQNSSTLNLISWSFYDWANSAFASIIQTFVFSSYFVRSVAKNPIQGTADWGFTLALVGIIIAFLGPLLGALADQLGYRKRWIAAFTILCIISSALLWFVKPAPEFQELGLVLAAIGILSSESACIFYNAMLPGFADPRTIGKWSGWGWSFGYLGGMSCLSLALFFFVRPDARFLPFLNQLEEEQIRITFVFVAFWYALFSLPLFLLTPKSQSTGKSFSEAIYLGLNQLIHSFKEIKKYKHIFYFLLTRMFYADALVTLFAFGGIYAASTFNLSEANVLLFGIMLNISAGIGAAVLACFDDWLGGRRMILFSLTALILFSSLLLLVTSQTLFWIFGLLLGAFVGPVQASSRSYLARITPKELRNQMFGFNTLAGKATSFLGPLLVGWATCITGTERAGLSVITLFLLLGWMGIYCLPETKTAVN